MALSPFQPTPFFANKNRAFWNLQLAGWFGAMLLRALSGIANGQPVSFLAVVVVNTIAGYSISLILAVIYRALMNRKPIITWGLSILSLAFAVILYTFIDAWVFSLYLQDSDTAFTALIIGMFFLNLMLLGAWSALYYAINFFLQVEEKADQLQRLEGQATSAQLAMLRYQLNPHFLFNTLNSISTLVLLKETEPANAMLSRLSSFLRYTLVNEPTGRVTVAQEVETLKLYLEIEKMRFEERLRTVFDIQEETRDALMPSLLLQPLVENSIKYAVTPLEEGADITITTRLAGENLRITVSDTGPGVQNEADSNATLPTAVSSTGVGLTNIRDRLAQAYGDNHMFQIRSSADQNGFAVIIELPMETREQQRREKEEREREERERERIENDDKNLVSG
ncbi:sensor histidine kinase [Alterisphingorhabdus coralli]|uniref:histidine kinase n=1 Tax=Alterisphingorhabdus coralli TaxID=3071408 RepID=A0AA97F5Y3_9SPHN|nr:histidine kinase [Parasphingorhabdus sp. SCSIO 66989]WOE74831.1 histidine kinase [Parasphingorhabdus sp. SCSIO 66989]